MNRRLAISVEGPTELEFVKLVLQPYLGERRIEVTAVVVTTKRVIGGPSHKGGAVNLDRAAREIARLLPNFDLVTTLYDFYGFGGKEPGESVEGLEDRLADKVGKAHTFLPYLQRYEFEALLFSSPSHIADAFDLPQTRNALESIVSACTGPEKINDNPVSAPSKRLQVLFPAYDKKLYGPIIAQEIGLSAIRSRCPRFDGWMSRLEEF